MTRNPTESLDVARRSSPEFAEALERARQILLDSISVKEELIRAHRITIVTIADVVTSALRNGRKLLLCGNGGSAADAQHLAAELLVRLRPSVNRAGLRALALATDTSSLTACGNDFGFETYFERQVQTLGAAGDVLIGITTSGQSSNIVRALSAGRATGVTTVGLLGGGGGPALAHCDYALVVPSSTTSRIQEAHITIGHVIMELVEDELLANGYLERT
jgi:D-sedoheptulose 7-phosphate isomerase